MDQVSILSVEPNRRKKAKIYSSRSDVPKTNNASLQQKGASQRVPRGDLVLKKILPLQTDFRGKWMPNWEGPYVVKKAFSGGALILSEIDGKIFRIL